LDLRRNRRLNKPAKLHYLYYSPNIIRIMKSWSTRWVVHVALMGEMKCMISYCILVGKLKGKWRRVRPRLSSVRVLKWINIILKCGLDSSGSE
jgi:hypothetical protein